jgi:hypothetical protein
MPSTFHKEVWAAFRPYAKLLVVDLLVAMSLWSFLAVFKALTTLIPLRDGAGKLIAIVHSAGVVIVFGVLAGFFILDVARLKRGLSV